IISDVGPRTGEQCSGPTRAAMHQGAKKSACRNTPPVKRATLNTSDSASIRGFLAGSGVLVISRGEPVIDHRSAANLHIVASADRSIHSISTQVFLERKQK